jgi:hypothetical protein
MSSEQKTNNIKYTVSLKGLPTPKGTITFSALKEIIDILSEGSERALRLALEGASVKRGSPPGWLSKSTDFVLRGIKKGSTVLEFEAPTLGSIAEEQIQQIDLWNHVPLPDETAITILTKSVRDAEKENLDSETYDRGVLETLLGFKKLFNGEDLKFQLQSVQRTSDRFSIDRSSYQKFDRIRNETPEPQAVLLTGFLNMIQHSQKRFELTLEDGKTVRGRIQESFINVEQIRNLWGKKVTVKGTLQYTPSKKPRYLDAEVITAKQKGDDVFNTIPLVFPAHDQLVQAQKNISSQSVVSDIWGQWPGDEAIDDLLNDLKATSAEK